MKPNYQFSIIHGKPLKHMLRCIAVFAFAGLVASCGPKTQDIQLSYLVKENKMSYQRIPGAKLLGQKPRLKASVVVTNTSDYGGVFKFYATMTSQGNSITLQNEEYIAAGATIELSDDVEINHYSFDADVEIPNWGISAPVKTITLP